MTILSTIINIEKPEVEHLIVGFVPLFKPYKEVSQYKVKTWCLPHLPPTKQIKIRLTSHKILILFIS